LIVEKAAVFSVLSGRDGVLVLLKASQAGVQSVDGEPGHGVVDGVVLGLADCLHAAGLVLDIHVVEGHVEQVDAIVHLANRGVNTREVRQAPVKEAALAGSFPSSGREDDQEGGPDDIKEDEGEDNTEDSGEINPCHGPGCHLTEGKTSADCRLSLLEGVSFNQAGHGQNNSEGFQRKHVDGERERGLLRDLCWFVSVGERFSG